MEESKKRKRRIQVSGGGIPGLLVVGGAFVIAALVAKHTNKRKANNKNHQDLPTSPSEKLKSKDGGGSDGLLSILETPPASEESHLWISIEQSVPVTDDSKEEIGADASLLLEPEAVKTIIVEKRLDLVINGKKENCIREEEEVFSANSDTEVVSVKGEKESCIHEEQGILCANSEIKILSVTSEKESYIHEEQEIFCANSEVEMLPVADEVHTTPDELPLSKFEGFLSSNMDMGLLVDANVNKEDYCEFVSSKEVAAVIAEGSDLSETFDILKENLSAQLEEVDHSKGNIDHSGGLVSTKATKIIEKCEISRDGDMVLEETQTVLLTETDPNADGEKFDGINNDMVLEETQTVQLIQRDANADEDSNYDGDYDNDVDDDEDEDDKGEGSEGTRDSSVDLNADAIWPAESLEQDSSVLKDMKFGLHVLRQKSNEASNEVEQEETVFKGVSRIEKNSGLRSKHPPRLLLSRTSLSLWLVLMVGLLLLLFIQHSSVFQHLHNPPLSTL